MDTSAVARHIPKAALPYPDRMTDRAKYHLWKAIYPAHNKVRDVLLATHLLHPPYKGRQDYLLGSLAPGRKMEDFLRYLEGREFGNHFIAWDDEGQVASLRRLEDFRWQYHLRIFEDGEVRGHYELTPESHPFKHYGKNGQVPRREQFEEFLGDWVIAAQS
jgi:hypothetical protein